MNKLSHRVTVL